MPKKLKRGSIRFLQPGDKVSFIGKRGRPVKHPIEGREYVIKIYRKKVKGPLYVNFLKRGVPQPKKFSKTMISRVKYVREVPFQRLRKTKISKVKFTVKSTKRFKSQIPKKVYKEIRKNKGKTFNLRIKVRNKIDDVSIPVFIGPKGLSDDELKAIITNQFLVVVGSHRIRVSDKLKALARRKLNEAKRERLSEEIIRQFERDYETARYEYSPQAIVGLEFSEVGRSERKKRG